MPEIRIEKLKTELEKVIGYLHEEFAKLQTGRASAALVEGIQVEAYGSLQPLKAVAGVTIEDARTILIQPWDHSQLKSIENALNKADLGCSPVNDGNRIRLCLPPMTEERRKDLVKIVHQLAEEARISVRQQRDKLREEFKQEKDEDLKFSLLEQLDKVNQEANDKIEESKKKKEDEVMTV